MRAEHAAQTSIHAQAARKRHPVKSSSRLALWIALGAFALLFVGGSAAALLYLLMRQEPEPALAAAPIMDASAHPGVGSPASTPSAQRDDAQPMAPSAGTHSAPTPTQVPQGRALPAASSRPAQAPGQRHRGPGACVPGLRLQPAQT